MRSQEVKHGSVGREAVEGQVELTHSWEGAKKERHSSVGGKGAEGQVELDHSCGRSQEG